MIKLRRRAKQNRTFDPASLPFVDEQLTAKGRVECLFSLNFNLNFYPNGLPLCYSELDFAVITGVSEVIQNKSRALHTAPDAVLQEHAILPLSMGEDRMLNERKRINSILGEGSSCRVNDRTRHAVLDTAPQEQANLEPSPSPLTGEGERSSDEGDIKYIQTTAPDTVSQGHAILPLSKGEDRMLNERKRINSILGEGSSCRVASAMLNLFQYLTNMKEELLAKKIFTPQHLASLACNLFTNKILNQVQDDITKNSHENFPFTPSEKERCKSLCIQTWHLNTSEKGRYKSQQFQAWHNNSNMKGGDKSLCIQAWHLNSNMKGGDKKCLA